LTGTVAWAVFCLGVLGVLALDLALAGRQARAPTEREAVGWVALWVTLSLVLGGAVWGAKGSDAGLQFFGSYLVEYALSVDNLFVFLMLFETFRVRPEHRRQLLLWGVLGAVVLRGCLLFSGVALVRRFQWLLVPFGGLLLYTAVKLVWQPTEEAAPHENAVVRAARRFLPMSEGPASQQFALVVREHGRLRFTPLFLVLVMVETTDLLFAFDSIPAVLGMSQDTFIVFTSNVCAVLGLRSLFFVLQGLMGRMAYLKPALAAVLAFVGAKMVLDPWLHVPLWASLLVIAGLLAAAVWASVVRPPRAGACTAQRPVAAARCPWDSLVRPNVQHHHRRHPRDGEALLLARAQLARERAVRVQLPGGDCQPGQRASPPANASLGHHRRQR
jgi:tellurite resistance protein TerC